MEWDMEWDRGGGRSPDSNSVSVSDPRLASPRAFVILWRVQSRTQRCAAEFSGHRDTSQPLLCLHAVFWPSLLHCSGGPTKDQRTQPKMLQGQGCQP